RRLAYMEWKNIYRGMAMGVSDIVPGVSGGTIAVILGIYDQFIASINGLFSKDWKRHLAFLIPLALGMGIAIVLFSQVMKWLLNHHEDRKSTRLNSSHVSISYAVFCLKKKKVGSIHVLLPTSDYLLF